MPEYPGRSTKKECLVPFVRRPSKTALVSRAHMIWCSSSVAVMKPWKVASEIPWKSALFYVKGCITTPHGEQRAVR
jgi:hypothetical protein